MKHPSSTPVPPYFLAVLLCSVPFWLAGARSAWQPIPGVPISATMAVVPGLVAIAFVARIAGRAGAAQWLRTALAAGAPGRRRWVFVGLLVPAAIMSATYVVMLLGGYSLPKPRLDIMESALLLLIFIVPALLEELGWSGYALVGLQRQMSALAASLVIGVIWAAWHYLPLLQAGRTIGWIAWWSVGTIALRVLTTWVFNNSGQSCVAAAAFHASENVSWQAFPNHGSHYDPAVHGLVLVAVSAAVVASFGWKTLSRGTSDLKL